MVILLLLHLNEKVQNWLYITLQNPQNFLPNHPRNKAVSFLKNYCSNEFGDLMELFT